MEKGRKDCVEGTERIGDREVAFRRHFDERGEFFTEYGSGPSYLCHFPRKPRGHQWVVSFDYHDAVMAKALSRRKDDWQEFYYHVEVMNKLLANDPEHQVAGDLERHVIAIRRAVITALRDLDSEPLRKLAAAVDAVEYVANRTPEDEALLIAIVKAAKAQGGVPYRAELQPYLAKKDEFLTPQALGERLKSLGFGWLPGGHPRKPPPRRRKQQD